MENASEIRPGSALQRFMESMNIDFYKWHDGISYDLDALNELNTDEIAQIEALLISRKDSDWRDVEALAALNTPLSIKALKDCLQSPNLECRLFAAKFLKEMGIADHIEEVVIRTLPYTTIGNGLTYALWLIKENTITESIRRTVLRCAMTGRDDIRVHCAAMALYLYGKANYDFDTEKKIIYEFHEKDPAARRQIFERLCQMVGLKADDVLM